MPRVLLILSCFLHHLHLSGALFILFFFLQKCFKVWMSVLTLLFSTATGPSAARITTHPFVCPSPSGDGKTISSYSFCFLLLVSSLLLTLQITQCTKRQVSVCEQKKSICSRTESINREVLILQRQLNLFWTETGTLLDIFIAPWSVHRQLNIQRD